MALGDQLAVDTQPRSRHVSVGDEPGAATARVVSHLEHRVDVLGGEIEDIPRRQPRAVGQTLGGHVHRVPAAVVVEHDHLGRASIQQTLSSGDRLRLDRRLPRPPILGSRSQDLTRYAEL